MQVYVPFAPSSHSWALPAVSLSLRQDGWKAQFEHMTDDEAYYRLFTRIWDKKETFCIVEHDIVVWPGGISELEACHEPWCVLPYYCSVGWIIDGLGCTKFSKELIEAQPDFFKEPYPTCCQHSKHYCGMDRFIAHRMNDLGIKPHVHSPGVVNLNDKWT